MYVFVFNIVSGHRQNKDYALYRGKQFVTKLLTQRINILFSSTQTPLFLAVKPGESKG